MVSKTVKVDTVDITLTIEKKGGQALRRLEIYKYDDETTVKIEVLETNAVKASGIFEKLKDGLTRFKNPSSSASDLEDDIKIVEEEGKSNPDEYITFIKITICHRGKKTVVRILARKKLDKPYLHEVNAYGNKEAIKTIKV